MNSAKKSDTGQTPVADDTEGDSRGNQSHERLKTLSPLMQKGYVISRADSREDREETYALRYAEYCVRMKSLNPDDYPARIETDAYDPTAVAFIGKYLGQTVGTTRLVFPVNGQFLMESGPDGFTVPREFHVASTGESSRLIGRTIRTEDGSVVSQALELLRAQCEWSQENGIERWLVASEYGFYQKLLTQGWPFILLGREKRYHGTISIPVVLEIQRLAHWFSNHRST